MSLVLLDRDGVINFDSYAYIKSVAEWIPIPHALEALARLTQAGYQTAIITNQSGIARGYFDDAILTAIHDKMQKMLAALGGRIDAIYYCPHHPDMACTCRKPQPYLLLKAASDFNCDIAKTPFIGDRDSDVTAAKQAGAIPYLISDEGGYSDFSVKVFADLNAAVTDILKK